jgi:hypothetical protein
MWESCLLWTLVGLGVARGRRVGRESCRSVGWLNGRTPHRRVDVDNDDNDG